MKREYVAFLAGGFAFGILFGFMLHDVVRNPPDLTAAATGESGMGGPRGPKAPTQIVGPPPDGGAPMMARINQLKRELEGNPENIAACVELADIFQRVGMWEQSAEFYLKAIAIEEPQPHPELLVNLGLCYRGLQRYDEALEAFDRAHALDGRNWQALFNTVVVAALDLQRYEDAFQALEAMEAIQPVPDGLDTARLQELREWLVQHQGSQEADGGSS